MAKNIEMKEIDSYLHKDKKRSNNPPVGMAQYDTVAEEIKHAKGANIIMTGAIVKELELFTEEEGLQGMNEMFNQAGKGKFEEANTKAFKAGYNL